MPAKRDYLGLTAVVRPASPHPRGGGTGNEDDAGMSDNTDVKGQGRDMEDQPAGRNVISGYKKGGGVSKPKWRRW